MSLTISELERGSPTPRVFVQKRLKASAQAPDHAAVMRETCVWFRLRSSQASTGHYDISPLTISSEEFMFFQVVARIFPNYRSFKDYKLPNSSIDGVLNQMRA